MASRKIAVGVTGGIAAYKTCELVRDLKKSGAKVRVAMSKAATKFVSDLTFATLSERPVFTSLFADNEKLGTAHIDLARWCELFVICPATADILAKAAHGFADDFITTTILATESKVIFCPAMNSAMWAKPIVQENIATLKRLGYKFVNPEWGKLATSAEGQGWGRLAAIPAIVDQIEQSLTTTNELVGKKVLVTAGPTQEQIDPVRFISNRSSGKMGFALARAAKLKGADVVLISGPNDLPVPQGIKYVEITTVDELLSATRKEHKKADILLMSAAVSDYQAREVATGKIKKQASNIVLEMNKSPDVLALLGKEKENCLHVGFALETDNKIANAKKKLKEKNMDMVILNDPLEAGAAFGGDTNVVSIIPKEGKIQTLPKMPKTQLADIILDRSIELLRQRQGRAIAI